MGKFSPFMVRQVDPEPDEELTEEDFMSLLRNLSLTRSREQESRCPVPDGRLPGFPLARE